MILFESNSVCVETEKEERNVIDLNVTLSKHQAPHDSVYTIIGIIKGPPKVPNIVNENKKG